MLEAIFEDAFGENADVFAIEIESEHSFDFYDQCHHASWSRNTATDDFYELALRTADPEAAKALVDDYITRRKRCGRTTDEVVAISDVC